jgi:ribosomal protein S8
MLSEINNPQKSAFLVVPIKYSQKAVTAMNILRSNKYIESYSSDETSELSILKVVFPVF